MKELIIYRVYDHNEEKDVFYGTFDSLTKFCKEMDNELTENEHTKPYQFDLAFDYYEFLEANRCEIHPICVVTERDIKNSKT